jgi:hypothetical protein
MTAGRLTMRFPQRRVSSIAERRIYSALGVLIKANPERGR